MPSLKGGFKMDAVWAAETAKTGFRRQLRLQELIQPL